MTHPPLSIAPDSFMHKLGMSAPIVSAPMGGVSGGALAAAVANAGGLGLIGAGYGERDWLAQQLDVLAQAEPKGPWGVGFITWCLTDSVLEEALARKPDVVMLSFGDPTPWVARCKAAGATVFMQVQSVRAAREAAQAGADVIVAQGAEAGGHGGGRATFSLVPAVVDAVAPLPVVAAGGIADGRGVAAALMLGAQAVLVGTRFVASQEALSHPNIKQTVIQASGDDTVRTRVFDIVRGLDWPAPYTGRALSNAFTQRWHGQEDALQACAEEHKTTFQAAVDSGQMDTAMTWAGEGTDLIKQIMPASDIVKALMLEASQRLRGAASLLV